MGVSGFTKGADARQPSAISGKKCLISTPTSGICDQVLENKCLSLIFHVFSRIILGYRRSIVNVGSGCGSVPSVDMLWPEPVLTKTFPLYGIT